MIFAINDAMMMLIVIERQLRKLKKMCKVDGNKSEKKCINNKLNEEYNYRTCGCTRRIFYIV